MSLEVITIFLSIQSKKREVDTFLNGLKTLLEKDDFNIDTEDIVDRLKELTAEEYSETKIDKDDLDPPLLFVFGKNINNKLVYIKLKIKGDQQRHVLCVSFHYAKEQISFPYA